MMTRFLRSPRVRDRINLIGIVLLLTVSLVAFITAAATLVGCRGVEL